MVRTIHYLHVSREITRLINFMWGERKIWVGKSPVFNGIEAKALATKSNDLSSFLSILNKI